MARRILLLVVVLTATAASLSAALRVSQRALDAKLTPRSAPSTVLRSASLGQPSDVYRCGAACTAISTCSDVDESIGELSPDFRLGTAEEQTGSEDSSEASEDEDSGDTHDMDEIVARGLIEIPAGALAAWLDHETSRLTSVILSPEPRPARRAA